MPAFDINAGVKSICQGTGLKLLSAEQLGAGVYSIAAAIQDKDGSSPRPITVTFSYASTPGSVEYDIYGAWDYTNPALTVPPSTWTKLGSTTNVNGDQVTLIRDAAGGLNFRFICVYEKTSPGVNATVEARQ